MSLPNAQVQLLRAAAAMAQRQSAGDGAANATTPAAAVAAARALAADLRAAPSASSIEPTAQPTGPPPATEDESSRRAKAAAAFAASLSGQKRSRWGGGTELAVASGDGGNGPNGSAAASKLKQSLVVSQLSDKLALFRKDRGVDAPTAAGQKLSLKLPVPDQIPGRPPRNWVAIFIGREGVNKKRLEQETGATIFVRGEGTQLRGAKPTGDDVEAMHVLIEASTQDALDAARVKVHLHGSKTRASLPSPPGNPVT